jgi:NDMA-dependent alcohol dehydrogenase
VKVRASVVTGAKEPWKTEEIEVDDPKAHEVAVKVAYAGLCQSDEHLRKGEFTLPPELLQMLTPHGSMFPAIGGHEGAGIVESVGPEVTSVAPGDTVTASFIPSCGKCQWCVSGRMHICDLGATIVAGPMVSDGTYRHHLGDEPLNRMCQVGSFAEVMVVNEASVVKVDTGVNLRAAALISCGLSTGFGAAVDRAKVRPGECVIVLGCGGVGSGAIQGARIAGAEVIIAVDPIESKVERAKAIGATHGAASALEATFLAAELTRGRLADVVIITTTSLTGDLIGAAVEAAGKDGRIVCVAISPYGQKQVDLDLGTFTLYNKTLMGSIFGSANPRLQIPRLLELYRLGQLKIDELVTQEYTLDGVQQGYDDLAAGVNVRGVVRFD